MDIKQYWENSTVRFGVVFGVIAVVALLVSLFIRPEKIADQIEAKKKITPIYAPNNTGDLLERQEMAQVQDELTRIALEEQRSKINNNSYEYDALYSQLERMGQKVDKLDNELTLWKTGQKTLERTPYQRTQVPKSRQVTVDANGNRATVEPSSVPRPSSSTNQLNQSLPNRVSGIRSVDEANDTILLQNGQVKTLVKANEIMTPEKAESEAELQAWRDKKEAELSEALAKLEAKPEKVSYKVQLPTTSLITGVLLSGMEAPTSVGSKREPLPAAVRIKHDALLPNNYRVDLRDCQALVSAVGSLSDRRAYMRMESIVCIDEQGRVAESNAKGYATGADGKAGIPGMLVARNGEVLKGSMWAGFFSGLAQGIAPQRVVGIDVNSEGGGFQTPDLGSIGAAAGLSGTATALDRIADYYVKMLEEIWPTINVDAFQEVTFFLQAPLTLTFQD